MSTDAQSDGLRGWQADALARLQGWSGGPFLINATPGAGKTRPALVFARSEFLRQRLSGVVVVCPTAPLTRQWARAAAELGLNLLPDATGPRPPRGFHGVVVTYARVGGDPGGWASVDRDTLVIADEAHHLGEELTWGAGFLQAFGGASRWLLLSGTPFRSDKTTIPGVRYSDLGVAVADVTYGYADAVRDGVCRPMRFVPFDGELSWRSGEVERTATFSDELVRREHGRRYRTAISTALEDGLPRILTAAHEKLGEVRASQPDAGGLVITSDSEHARAVARSLRALTGRDPVVVLHADRDAHQRLAVFRDSREPWIVAVNMISEGVDIPRLRVGVYVTTAKTAMIFRQIVGRFVRTRPGAPAEPSWLYLPGDPTLREHAGRIEREVLVALKKNTGALNVQSEFDVVDDAPAGEGEERASYEPLAAAVTLENELRTATVAAEQTATGGSAASPAVWPVFERRAWLLQQRGQLAAAVAKSQRMAKRDVLAWAGREVGAGESDATVEQLEDIVELLLRRLSPTLPRLKTAY